MEDGRREIGRGLLFLGSAGALARAVDLAAIVVVLGFITKEEVGAATIAWALTTLLEPAVGLGLGTALVRASRISPAAQRASVSVALLSAISLAALLAAAGPAVAAWAAWPPLSAYLAASGLKLVFVGLALVPLHLLTRALRFRALSAAQVLSTLLAAIARVAAAALGAGAWALVVGHVLHSVFLLFSLLLVGAEAPRPGRELRAAAPLLRFGVRAGASELLERAHRHMDTLLVGHFLGPGAVGVYKVAVDMTVGLASALGDVVNKATLPVLSRLAGEPARFKEAFLFTTRKVTVIAAPALAVVTGLGALLLDRLQGGEFSGARALLPPLALAALLRVSLQLFPMAFFARGRPGESLRLSWITTASLFLVLGGSLALLGPRLGAASAGVGVLLQTLSVAPFAYAALRRTTGLRLRDHLRMRAESAPACARERPR